jgi:hypothetical protein
MLPSRKAERVFELPRLNEIAQAMRQPFAVCFLRRAILTMKPAQGGDGFSGTPEGQAKIRARISPAGQVMRAEVLESGFADDDMESCLTDTVRRQRFPENKGGNTHFIDVIYWVSLGAQRGIDTPQFRDRVRRESISAAIRAKPCLQGRLDAGHWVVDGLNLVDREGATLVNRVEQPKMTEAMRACLAQAFSQVRLPRDSDAFVRPVATQVAFDISRDGTIEVDGEQWLKLLEMEEAAQAARDRAAAGGDEDVDELDATPEPPAAVGLGAAAPTGRATTAAASKPAEPGPPPQPTEPREDPGQGGLRLDLGARSE